MKTKLSLFTFSLTAAALMSLTGCISMGIASSSDGSDSGSGGGIDPVTMAGIEASNRATDEQARASSQAAIDQANLNEQLLINQMNNQ